MVDFDLTIGKILDWSKRDEKTLGVVTANHETVGFALNGSSISSKKVDGKFTTKNHTGVMVPVFAYGLGADELTGINEN